MDVPNTQQPTGQGGQDLLRPRQCVGCRLPTWSLWRLGLPGTSVGGVVVGGRLQRTHCWQALPERNVAQPSPLRLVVGMQSIGRRRRVVLQSPGATRTLEAGDGGGDKSEGRRKRWQRYNIM